MKCGTVRENYSLPTQWTEYSDSLPDRIRLHRTPFILPLFHRYNQLLINHARRIHDSDLLLYIDTAACPDLKLILSSLVIPYNLISSLNWYKSIDINISRKAPKCLPEEGWRGFTTRSQACHSPTPSQLRPVHPAKEPTWKVARGRCRSSFVAAPCRPALAQGKRGPWCRRKCDPLHVH